MITAIDKYDLIRKGHCFQLLYNHDTVTSFEASRTEPIKTIGQNEPGKICAKPTTE
jgi:hypothetical protein